MRNKNKWLAVLLAGALCGSNAVPALAANNSTDADSASTEAAPPVETPTPETEVPEAETPEIEVPETEIPETEVPETEVPETEAPEVGTPETEVPETEIPETEVPEVEAPETEVPETEAPEAEAPEVLASDGWVFENSYWYYYVGGEKIKECVHLIDGKWWLFGYNGELVYNAELHVKKYGTESWNYYRSTSDGSLEIGWYYNGTHWFFYDREDGHRYTQQKFEDGGNLYYINSNGWLLTSDWYIDDEGKTYWADSSGVLTEKSASEWVFSEGYWYYYKDSVPLKDGMYVIDGCTYHFNYDGRMTIGSFWYYDEESGKSGYKLADENGQVITWGKDWQRVGEEYYFFEESDWIVINQFKTISGKDYYFHGDGRMAKGIFSIYNGNEKTYVTDDSGALSPSCKTGGWAQYDNRWLYFKAPYQLAKNEFLDIGGNTYYFYGPYMQEGQFTAYNGKTYFANSSGAIIKNQWFTQQDNYWYCAKEDGSLYTDGVYEISGKKYYFSSRGNMETGLIYVSSDTRYIADDNGVLLSEGWTELNSNWYYVNSDSTIALSQWIGASYYVDYSGIMVTGSRLIDDVYYYFDSNGYLIYDASSGKAGWQFNNGYWYYFNEAGKPVDGWVGPYYFEHGKMLTNTFITDSKSENMYYVGSNGRYVTNGWHYIKASNFASYDVYHHYGWIYVDSNGVVSENTWEYIDGNWYYFSEYILCNWGRQTIDGTDYWFDESGVCLNPNGTVNFRGWTYLNGEWYYFNEDGTYMKNTKAVINGVTYYFDFSGIMYSDTIVRDEMTKKIYYYDYSGAEKELSSGWHHLNDEWYYVNEDGTYADGIQYINGSYYSFFSGYMEVGWIYVPEWGDTYWFNASGAWQDISEDGWYFDGYDWRYFQNGKPLKGVHTIDGAIYDLHEYDGSMYTGGVSESGFLYGNSGARLYNSWYYNEIEKEWYYADASGRPLYGEHQIDGTTYWFNDDGVWVK